MTPEDRAFLYYKGCADLQQYQIALNGLTNCGTDPRYLNFWQQIVDKADELFAVPGRKLINAARIGEIPSDLQQPKPAAPSIGAPAPVLQPSPEARAFANSFYPEFADLEPDNETP